MPLCPKRDRAEQKIAEQVIVPTSSHPYVGLWATPDGYIRHQLSADGRYEEDRGPRHGASKGRYSIEHDRIEYVDDTGFAADGEFHDGALHHAGMVLYRQDA
jgi:putative ligand-binding protein with streptavidin-like fold